MFYFGQEWGEHGMDTEGFSGHDGRTTIFDYWSLNPSQGDQELKALYQRVLNIARSEKAVVKGQTFDLMYVNQQYCRQFAFLRKTGKDMLLVVVNFDDRDVDVQVRMAPHAMEFLQIPEGKYKSKDLLSAEKQTIELVSDGLVPMTIKARNARVWKITLPPSPLFS
jgi:hypothetical protein